MAAKENKSKVVLWAMIQSRVVVALVYEDWDLLRTFLPLARKHEKEGEGHYSLGFNITWVAISHYDLYHMTGKNLHKREGRRAHRRIKKFVTNGAAMLLGPLQLLDAMETLCVKNHPLSKVDKCFEKAFVALSKSGNSFMQALGNERLAKLYLQEEVDETKGKRYLGDAIRLYQRWGAFEKVEWLEKRYNHLA
eukprot:CAMPEP_0119022476 /NCGR_PEP_ID=MMETSP1176-20130426/28121_1 /TAXON_ID=265551 /ORGANISM="Synedropsis recta cf, Strain CCMP1620" /LENGTH=192 /DNA_ID=CAMNT_0006977359 /DNA_START=1 /DNA_END=575 /DNA_ORIENTATION=+